MDFLNVVNKINITQHFATYPNWMLSGIEEEYIALGFRFGCICGKYTVTYTAFDFVKVLYKFALSTTICAIFFPDLYRKFDTLGTRDLFLYIVHFVQPFLFVISFISIPILWKLLAKDSSAFTLQLFQVIASILSLLFVSQFFRYGFNYVLTYMFDTKVLIYSLIVLTNVFFRWCFFLSFTLLLDRFICVWKPLTYKNHASHKLSICVAFFELFLSLCFCVPDFFFYYYPTSPTLVKAQDIALFVQGIGFLLLFAIEIIICILFGINFKRNIGNSNSQLRSHQTNVSCILLGTTAVDAFPLVLFAVDQITSSNITGVPMIEFEISTTLDVVIVICPIISLIICITLSKMYRKAFFSLFCCEKCVKLFNLVPFPFKNRSTKVSQITDPSSSTRSRT